MSRSVVLLSLALFASTLHAGWTEYRSGPYRVFSNAGDKPARERLNWLEQSRHVVAALLSKKEVQPEWPIYVVLYKTQKESQAFALPAPLMLGRNAYYSVQSADVPPSREWKREMIGKLLDTAANPWEEGIRAAFLDVFTTFDANGTILSIGGAIPDKERSPGWARLNYLMSKPETYGTMRVFLNNLDQGGDLDLAVRNAFHKSVAELDKEAAAYTAAGNLASHQPTSRALNPNRDFRELNMDDAQLKLLQADLLLANPQRATEAQKAFAALSGTESAEGLALAAVATGDKTKAKELLANAASMEGAGARVNFELAKLETEPVTVKGALERAIKLNPRWAEPHAEITRTLQNPAVQAQAWKNAAQLRPGEKRYWVGLAESLEKAQQFADAGKAWGMAERAAGRAEADQMRARRNEAIEAKAAREEELRKQAKEEQQREMNRLRDEAVAEVRAAEEAANKRLSERRGGAPAPTKVEKWWEGPKPEDTAAGTLEKVDCLPSGVHRFVLRAADGNTTQVAVRDAKSITSASGVTFACGVQKSPVRLKIGHNAKKDAKLGTVGDAIVIEVQ